MQFITLFCVLCLLVLQPTISVTSFAPFLQSPDIETPKLHVARRLRAPLMGRSIITPLNDDTFELIKNDTNDMNSSDEYDIMKPNKQSLLLALLKRQRRINSKRKGPLFG
ncbi:unnamed protein product [Rotaria sordida]|uniref:Uncharacterized protein n=1 Tax=Rotaria sordida TaxID=392033 RepID=A0A814S7C6_9BILA|nr:unnamed protein product [Rotaria sordida]CAF1143213.1 unnamed protein product [Rotaria sordida]CAF3736756.1 unnamed protein product [Rotaria sordida]